MAGVPGLIPGLKKKGAVAPEPRKGPKTPAEIAAENDAFDRVSKPQGESGGGRKGVEIGRKGPYVPPKPKGGPPDGNFGPKDPEVGKLTGKRDAQPGPGAQGTGGGRDTPGAGKDRGQFEQDRAKDRGTGKDRPPIYTPKDDGERGGYVNRATPTGSLTVGKKASMSLPVIDKRTVKQKLADASRRRSS